MSSFDFFTDRARHVVSQSQKSAIAHQRGFIGTEDLLAAICREESGVGVTAMNNLGISAKALLRVIESRMVSGEVPPSGKPTPLTPEAKQVLVSASEEARATRFHYIATEHLLLALATTADKQPDTILGQVFAEAHLDPKCLRREIIALIDAASFIWLICGEAGESLTPLTWTSFETSAAQAMERLPTDNPTAPFTHIVAVKTPRWDGRAPPLLVGPSSGNPPAIRRVWNAPAPVVKASAKPKTKPARRQPSSRKKAH